MRYTLLVFLGRMWGGRVLMTLALGTLFFTFAPRVGDQVIGSLKQGSSCKVIHISDGDTVIMRCPNRLDERVRILGLDTAELNADCLREWGLAIRAKWALRWMIWRAHVVTLNGQELDRYHRRLMVIKTDGVDVADRLIGMNLARPYAGGRRAGWCMAEGEK